MEVKHVYKLLIYIIIDKVSIYMCACVCALCSYHQPHKSTYLRVIAWILRAAETKVPHLLNHLKEVYSKGILFISHSVILPQTVAVTGRAGPLVLKCNPFARHEKSQKVSTNYFGWMFQTRISLHKLTGAEKAGSITHLPLKQVT